MRRSNQARRLFRHFSGAADRGSEAPETDRADTTSHETAAQGQYHPLRPGDLDVTMRMTDRDDGFAFDPSAHQNSIVSATLINAARSANCPMALRGAPQ
jgi:hypothetical protein